MDAIYETFKKTKDNKNDKYGVKNSGNTGKNFYNRSFGGGMSNRKYTKEQVKPHKLKKSIGVISSDIKNKTIIPPLYPVSNASSQKGYRTGYLNNDLNDIPRTSDLTTYYQPMQNLEDVKLKKLKDKLDKDLDGDLNCKTKKFQFKEIFFSVLCKSYGKYTTKNNSH